MKKQINFVLIVVLLIISLILVIPFSPLRRDKYIYKDSYSGLIYKNIKPYYDSTFQYSEYSNFDWLESHYNYSLKKYKLRKPRTLLLDDDFSLDNENQDNYIRSAVGLRSSFATSGIITSKSEDKQNYSLVATSEAKSNVNRTFIKNGETSLQGNLNQNKANNLPLDGIEILYIFSLLFLFIKLWKNNLKFIQ